LNVVPTGPIDVPAGASVPAEGTAPAPGGVVPDEALAEAGLCLTATPIRTMIRTSTTPPATPIRT
jgi:hypothetical protein